MELIIESLPVMIEGMKLTIYITVISLILGFIIGLIIALFRMSKIKPLLWIGISYINIVRGTPLLILLFFIYLGLNSLSWVSLSPFNAAILAVTIYVSGYLAEIIRGGVESIDKGQIEAARSVGLSSRQTMINIVLPQALRRMLPTFVNQAIITLKDTSLASVIGVTELTQQGEIIISRTFESFKIWPLVGLFYFVLVYILTKFSLYVERRFKVN